MVFCKDCKHYLQLQVAYSIGGGEHYKKFNPGNTVELCRANFEWNYVSGEKEYDLCCDSNLLGECLEFEKKEV